MHVSICSYTYNDGNLLDGLLNHLGRTLPAPGASGVWLPAEVVIMDDGSDPQYALPPDPGMDVPVRLLRHGENLGFHKAKSDCLDAAKSDFILALDCDARPSPDWVDRALPHFDDPTVAVVGGGVSYDHKIMGNGPTARYLYAFDADVRPKPRGPVDMVPGQAWLIRRAAWKEVQGFGHDKLGCLEDHALGRRLRESGHVLIHEPDARSSLVRRLSRRAMVKRFWAWMRHNVPGLMARGEDPLTAFLVPMMDRLEGAISNGELVFTYLELLYLAHAMNDVSSLAPELLKPVTPCLLEALKGHRRLAGLFRADLLRMGIPVPSQAVVAVDHPAFTCLRQLLDNLERGGILSWIENEGIVQLMAEEAEPAGISGLPGNQGCSDYSVYEAW